MFCIFFLFPLNSELYIHNIYLIKELKFLQRFKGTGSFIRSRTVDLLSPMHPSFDRLKESFIIVSFCFTIIIHC